MLEIWFVRHGETDWNVQRRIQGWSDIPLNSHGLRQAQLLSEVLQGIPFQALYSSDLQRARTTAQYIGSAVALPTIPMSQLRERSYGDGEGLFHRDVYHLHPEGFPNREPDRQVLNRAKHVLSHMETHHQGRVLCVSHGGFIRTVLNLLGMNNVPTLQNTSICCVSRKETGWLIGNVNWHHHLRILQCDLPENVGLIEEIDDEEIDGGPLPRKGYEPDRQTG